MNWRFHGRPFAARVSAMSAEPTIRVASSARLPKLRRGHPTRHTSERGQHGERDRSSSKCRPTTGPRPSQPAREQASPSASTANRRCRQRAHRARGRFPCGSHRGSRRRADRRRLRPTRPVPRTPAPVAPACRPSSSTTSRERSEWSNHLLDLVRQEPKKSVLPSHTRGVSRFYSHDEFSSAEDSAGRVREKSLEARRDTHPVAIGDGSGAGSNPDSSVKAEYRREDDHNGSGPQGEDGEVRGLPALEPVERATSREESGR